MRADNPDFNFGYEPLPEGLLGPTSRTKWRRPPHLILLAVLAVQAVAVGTFVLWSNLGETDDPRVHKHDPIEDDPNMKHILDAADRETQQVIAGDGPDLKRQLGYSHRVWAVKKGILRVKYGVEWRTPAEMNPKIAFD